MKTPKGLLSHGFTRFSPPWQGRHERQRMSVLVTGKAWQPCQVLVDQESEEWLQLEIGLYVAFEASLIVTCFLQSGSASRKFLSLCNFILFPEGFHRNKPELVAATLLSVSAPSGLKDALTVLPSPVACALQLGVASAHDVMLIQVPTFTA